MKKVLALLLSLIIVLSFSACGGKKTETAETPSVESEAITEEIPPVIGEENPSDKKEEVKEPVKTEDKKEETAPVPQPSPEKEPEPVPLPEEKPEEKPAKSAGNTLLDAFKAEASSKSASELAEKLSKNAILPFAMDFLAVEEGYLAGFDSEIHGFKEGASFFPIMSAIPFVGYVFTLESEGEVSSFINTLKSNANLRWNVCSEAEEMVCGSVGNKVFFVMTNKDLTK